MQNPLKKLFKKQSNKVLPKVQVIETSKRCLATGECVRAIVAFMKGSANLANEVPRYQFDRALRGRFNDETIEATLTYLALKGYVWGDKEKVRCQGSLWNCANCEGYIVGDGWHIRTGCKGGRVLTISRSNEGKFCGGYRPIQLQKEFQDGWIEGS